MNESPNSQDNTLDLLRKSNPDNPEFANSLNKLCVNIITQIMTQIKEQLPIYLQNNLQNTCPTCRYMQECAKYRTKQILSNPEINRPIFILYHKDGIPEDIRDYLSSHANTSVKEHNWYLVFKMPYTIDLHWDTLVKRASADKQGEDGKITLKKYAGPIELPSLKLNAIIKDIFWDAVAELKEDKDTDFILHRINERGEHCGEYYYLLAIEPKDN